MYQYAQDVIPESIDLIAHCQAAACVGWELVSREQVEQIKRSPVEVGPGVPGSRLLFRRPIWAVAVEQQATQKVKKELLEAVRESHHLADEPEKSTWAKLLAAMQGQGVKGEVPGKVLQGAI